MLLPPYSYRNDSLGDCLLDLSVRFVVNCPREDLNTAERLFFQVEEAHWFYEDFVRLDNPQFPSMKLRTFVDRLFNACPFLLQYQADPLEAFNSFQSYKSLIPVRGGIILNNDMTKVLMVKGWRSNSTWGFPKGKINKDEPDSQCAIREVYEECGFDMTPYLVESDYLEVTRQGKNIRLYVIRGVPEDTVFETQTRKEISKISWHTLNKLPFFNRKAAESGGSGNTSYYMAAPFMPGLKKYINKSKGLATSLTQTQTQALQNVLGSEYANDEDAASKLLGLLRPAATAAPDTTVATENPSDTAILLSLIKSDHKTTDLESAQQVLGLYAQQSDTVPSVEPTKIVLPDHYSSLESPAVPTPPLPPSSILQDLVSTRRGAKSTGLLSILQQREQPRQPKPSNNLLDLLQPKNQTPEASTSVSHPVPGTTSGTNRAPLKPQTHDLISLLSKPTEAGATPADADSQTQPEAHSGPQSGAESKTPAPVPQEPRVTSSTPVPTVSDLMSLLTPSLAPSVARSVPEVRAGPGAESLVDLLKPDRVQATASEAVTPAKPIEPTDLNVSLPAEPAEPAPAEQDATLEVIDLGVVDAKVHLLDLLDKPPNKDPYPSTQVLLAYLSKATST